MDQMLLDGSPIRILLVEDNPGDVRLTAETFRTGKVANELHVAKDGEDAMAFLRQEPPHTGAQRPDLVILDLNLPRKDGIEVLAEIKQDDSLHVIPIVILTTSAAERDVLQSYELKANAYVTKPIDVHDFIEAVTSIEDFWLNIVRLPRA
jgi:two-component system, chemotaxis family, response regulator Rcp1